MVEPKSYAWLDFDELRRLSRHEEAPRAYLDCLAVLHDLVTELGSDEWSPVFDTPEQAQKVFDDHLVDIAMANH